MFIYAQAEAALASIHRMPDAARGAFSGRIKHLQRLGVAPSQPGRGKKIAYDPVDVYAWAFALELAAFGLDPIVIKRLIEPEMGIIKPKIFPDRLTSPHRDLYYFFHPNFLGQGWPVDVSVAGASHG